MTEIDWDEVPLSLAPVRAAVERWAIADDGDREDAVHRASSSDLEALVELAEHPAVSELYDWLVGPAADRPTTTYSALTGFTMAIDSARLVLRRRSIAR